MRALPQGGLEGVGIRASSGPLWWQVDGGSPCFPAVHVNVLAPRILLRVVLGVALGQPYVPNPKSVERWRSEPGSDPHRYATCVTLQRVRRCDCYMSRSFVRSSLGNFTACGVGDSRGSLPLGRTILPPAVHAILMVHLGGWTLQSGSREYDSACGRLW